MTTLAIHPPVAPALRAVAADEPVFAGHFPGQPILPGVLLLRFAVDAAAGAAGRPLALVAIRRLRFSAPVLPPAEVRVEFDAKPDGDDRLRLRCKWFGADGAALARGDLIVAEAR